LPLLQTNLTVKLALVAQTPAALFAEATSDLAQLDQASNGALGASSWNLVTRLPQALHTRSKNHSTW